jgi:hypothetical protein
MFVQYSNLFRVIKNYSYQGVGRDVLSCVTVRITWIIRVTLHDYLVK